MEEGEVEPDVVADDDRAAEDVENLGQLLREGRLAGDHLVGNAGERGNAGRNPPLGIQQFAVIADPPATFDAGNAELDDAVAELRRRAGRLDVEEGDRDVDEFIKEGHGRCYSIHGGRR
jgi:hypothetical protein